MFNERPVESFTKFKSWISFYKKEIFWKIYFIFHDAPIAMLSHSLTVWQSGVWHITLLTSCQFLTCLVDIWVAVGWTMKMYLSMAISRMEKDEKKMQVACVPPTSLQSTSYNTSTQLTFIMLFIVICQLLQFA